MKTSISLTIRTPRSMMQSHHKQGVVSFCYCPPEATYISARGTDGSTAQLYISENQAKWLHRWLGQIIAQEHAARKRRKESAK